MKILCFIQTLEGTANNNSLESLCAAQNIAKNNNAELHATNVAVHWAGGDHHIVE